MNEALISVLGILLAAFLTILGTRKHAERQRFIEEAARFKEAFAPAITQFKTTLGNDRDILFHEFDAQEKAFNRFVNFVPSRKLALFTNAWERYKQHAQERNSGGPLELFAREALDVKRLNDEDHLNEVAQMRNDQAIELIEQLLRYAKVSG